MDNYRTDEERIEADKKLWEIYSRLDLSGPPAGYDWPSFIEASREISSGDVLAAIQVAIRAIVFCERNYGDDKGPTVQKTDKKFVIPFSILYSMYAEHFKRYLPDEPVPSVQEVSQAFIKEVKDCDIHEVETKQ